MYLLRNLYADQEAMVRTRREMTDLLKIGERVQQLGPCGQLFSDSWMSERHILMIATVINDVESK